jgi:6-phosphogluconolactonase (cycloisomerase 2 family)
MKMKTLAIILCAVAVVATVAVLISRRRGGDSGYYTLYIGGYGNAAVKCIFNSKSLECTINRDFKARNPSYLLTANSPKRVYGVSESGSFSGVWGYMNNSLDQSLGEVKDGGADACYLTFFNNHLITAGYGKGKIGVYPLDTAGRIMPACQVVSFPSDDGISRLHMVKVLTAPQTGNNYLLVTDKGCDRVYSMRITDGEDGFRLTGCDSAFISVPKGYGPRHMEFSRNGKYMYLLCETSGKILVYSVKEVEGNIILTQIQEAISDKTASGASADIHLSPDGKFLYSSNRRGKDGIAIFKTLEDGSIERIAYQVTLQWPRSFAISPDGDFLFVACQKDKTLQIFRRDKSSGYLSNTGKTVSFPDLEPSCVLVRNY